MSLQNVTRNLEIQWNEHELSDMLLELLPQLIYQSPSWNVSILASEPKDEFIRSVLECVECMSDRTLEDDCLILIDGTSTCGATDYTISVQLEKQTFEKPEVMDCT